LKLIVAADFFTIEAWTPRGLQRFIVLFLIELSTGEGGDRRHPTNHQGLDNKLILPGSSARSR